MSFVRRIASEKRHQGQSYGAIGSSERRVQSGPPSNASATAGNDKDPLAKLHHEVNEVKVILKDNIEKAVERGTKTESLLEKTGLLEESSKTFVDNSTQLKEEMKSRNWHLICCIIFIVIVVLGFIALVVLYYEKII